MIRLFGAALAGAVAVSVFADAAPAQGIKLPTNQAPAAPAAGSAPAGQSELGPVVGDGKIIVRVRSMRVGQKMAITFQDFPEPGDADVVQVVAAGAPDNVQPNSQGEKPLDHTFLGKWQLENGWEIGPFAPGLYEIRWLTRLYNNERKYEIGARAQFSVTR